MTERKLQRNRRGFTLTEVLLALAILIILLALAMIPISRHQRSIRQTELDSKAETIYLAAQNRLSQLQASGRSDEYGKDRATALNNIPWDAEQDKYTASTLYYVTSAAKSTDTSAAGSILPREQVEAELWDANWVIEYDPGSGSVYAVFYSEKPMQYSFDAFNPLRSRDRRVQEGATVGYYGGDSVQSEDTGKLTPKMEIINKERLLLKVICDTPRDPLHFYVTVTDAQGHSTGRMELTGSEVNVSYRTYTVTMVLDDLTEGKRFSQQRRFRQLTPGSDLTLKVEVESDSRLVDSVTGKLTTNSLFAEVRDGGTTAVVTYARHLQNLDEGSGLPTAITRALQEQDIQFVNTGMDDGWDSCYPGRRFTPIYNENLAYYDSTVAVGIQSYHPVIYELPVDTDGDGGLFESFRGTLRNIRLCGAQISAGGNAGGLAGSLGGGTTIEGCQVYLSPTRDKLSSKNEQDIWISGATAGGLVGRCGYDLTVRNSFASTVLEGGRCAGGLVGYISGTRTVYVEHSYADCYLTAPVTGGLVGGAAQGAYTTLTNCYAVGYQTAGTRAAGLVNGTLDRAEATYSACAFYGDAQDIYTTAVGLAGSAATAIDHVFYLRGDLSDNYTALEGTDGRTYDQLCSDAFRADINRLYGVFTAPSGSDSHPYNLLNQGLSTYSYPRLTALEHYGDWQAQFESDALVYYEVYSDGTYGFFGGNVDSLSETKTIVGDGYAVALSQQPAAGWSLTVSCGTSSITLTSASTRHTAYYNGEAYYLFPVTFPAAVTAPSGTHAAFRQEVTVGSRTYYFNPYFAKSVTTGTGTPDTIYLRTARHLYALSLYYTSYAAGTGSSTYLQERDIDYATYDWSGYTAYTSVRQQAPIDSANGFAAQYDGDGHTITGVSFVSDSRGSIGMFATVARSGQVRNTVLMASGSEAVRVYGQLNGSTVRTYAGVLAGRNYGIIANCAASGYGFVGSSGSRDYGLVAYNYSTLYIGGLVGGNFASGSSRNGSLGIFSSEANCPSVIVSAYNASVYAGGLAGVNNGAIQSSYALGSLFAKDVRSSTVWLSGFAGSNNGGSLRYCYSATALTAAGEAEVYGLTRIGGGALECCYLNGGTYSYGGHLYAYNTAANSFSSSAAGRPITGADLEKLRLSGFSRAAVTRYDGTDSYPYPAVVRNDANRVVHYGQWPTLEHIGTLGVFYWEYESGGSAGYHLSYVGTDDGTPISGSSLCTQHNDGGVVTRYGYGYFCATDTVTSAADISYQFTNCRTGTRRSEVEQALAAQMKGYSFVAFETGPVSRTAGDGSVSWTREDTMYLTGADVNSQWTLSYGGGSYTYSVCPFFADAITLTGVSIDGIGSLPVSAALPGAEADSAYEIRSVSQLQNINWNYGTLSTDHYVSGSTDNNITKYPYLGSYRNSVSSGQDNFTNETRRYWVQSHDVDAVAEGLGGTDDHPFTPIGSMVDTAHVDNGANSQPYAAYFASNYDGDAYTIRNIQIRSTAQCIGLFGFTVGADLKDIIMYSDQGNEVINDAAGTHWYAMGGLVGFAGAGKNGASFTNCSVSGYIIRDLRANNPGWGGGCVGGLVGATNMNITGCSAVTDIIINISYDIGYRNLRVGGIAGVCRATLDKCYAGGSIQAEEMRNNYNGTGRSTNIWVAGLVGGVILRDQGNLESSMGTTSNPLTVQNCYSYVKLPTTTNAKTHVVASFAIASNGEMLHSFSIRYNSNGIQYTIPNPHAIIRNCYCLTSAVVNTNDYTSFRNLSDADWKAGKNINMKDTSNVRRVVLTNDRSPYISYQDMADPDKLAAWLNNGVSASPLTFDFVTVEENGVRIDGKYSFPGADAGRLDGLNYPFPTILTQLDAFGRTVNVHYGPWPMHGLYWESTSADLDLFADRGDGRLPTLTVGLYPENNAVNTGQTPAITLLNEDGTPADDTLIGSTAAAAYDAASGCWQVTFTASAAGGEGVVVARASLGSYTADLTIRVGAVLSLTHDKPAGVTVRYGAPSETVTLSLRDSHGDPVTADAAKGETIGWSVAAETLADGTAVVECDAADIRAVAGQAGDFTLPVTGFAAGDSAITVTCTYTYLENGVPKRIQSSTIISARSLRDAVGLVYDVEEDTVLRTTVSGVYLPCEGTGSTEGGDVTAPDFERQTGSLYLFAGNAYTDLNDFTVDLSGLTAVDSGGNALDGTRWAIYAGDVIEADDYRYRLLTVETDQPRRLYISGTVTLRRNGVTYRLTLTNYPCGADPAP